MNQFHYVLYDRIQMSDLLVAEVEWSSSAASCLWIAKPLLLLMSKEEDLLYVHTQKKEHLVTTTFLVIFVFFSLNHERSLYFVRIFIFLRS
jgi:hypothetical protein